MIPIPFLWAACDNIFVAISQVSFAETETRDQGRQLVRNAAKVLVLIRRAGDPADSSTDLPR